MLRFDAEQGLTATTDTVGIWNQNIRYMGVCNNKPKSTTKLNQRPLKIGAMQSYWEQSINYLDGREHHLKVETKTPRQKKIPISDQFWFKLKSPGTRTSYSHLVKLLGQWLGLCHSHCRHCRGSRGGAAAAGLGSVTRSCLGGRCSSEQFVIQMTKTITIFDNIKTKNFNNSNNKTDYNKIVQ